jgi:hypothetical protein
MIELVFILAAFLFAAVAFIQSGMARYGCLPPPAPARRDSPANSLPDIAQTRITFVYQWLGARKRKFFPVIPSTAGKTHWQARLAPSLLGAVLRCRRTQAEEAG